MDIRYLLPEYTKLKLQPGIIAYWDIGYYRNLHDAPDDEYNKGWISSYGGGISLRIMDTATFALYIHNAWFGNTTIEDDRITYFELDFGFHQ